MRICRRPQLVSAELDGSASGKIIIKRADGKSDHVATPPIRFIETRNQHQAAAVFQTHKPVECMARTLMQA